MPLLKLAGMLMWTSRIGHIGRVSLRHHMTTMNSLASLTRKYSTSILAITVYAAILAFALACSLELL